MTASWIEAVTGPAGRFVAASVVAQLIRLGNQVDRGDVSTIRGITFGKGTILAFPVLRREFDLESRPVPSPGGAPAPSLNRPILQVDDFKRFGSANGGRTRIRRLLPFP